MGRVEERFRSHLVEDESVRALTSGRLLGAGVRGRAAIGLTDRRLLCVSPTGEFVDVRYDYVCSIRSRNRTRVRYRSEGGPNRTRRLLAGITAFALLVAGVVAATPIGRIQGLVTAIVAVATVAIAAAVQALRTRSGVGRATDQIAVGAGVLGLFGLVGVALLATGVSVPLYGLVTLGGLALVRYAASHREELDGLGIDGHRESLLRINTVDGETVAIAVDADSSFDRELGASVHRTEPAPVEIPLGESSADRPPDSDGSATVRST